MEKQKKKIYKHKKKKTKKYLTIKPDSKKLKKVAKHAAKIGAGILLIFLLCKMLPCKAQPLKNPDELVVELKGLKKDQKISYDKTKISVSLVSGKLGDFQTSAIFKMSGKKSSIGGNAWLKLNPKSNAWWIGGEVSSDNNLNLDTEVFLSYEWYSKNKKHTLFPYIAILLKKEVLSEIGLKYYYAKAISLGTSFCYIPKENKSELKIEDFNISVYLGIPLSTKVVSNLFKELSK